MTVNGYEIGPKADLQGADLRGANLRGANLRGANLWGANLQRANLWGANLWGANLQEANLQGANLQEANLQEASLQGANLWGASLQGANLRGANLQGANLQAANLGHWSILPDGDLIGYKRIGDVLVTLSIPADARRVHSPTSRKCRAEWAVVIAVDNPEGRIIGGHDPNFVYQVGREVIPDSFNDDIRVVCTHGIHFYITKQEAIYG